MNRQTKSQRVNLNSGRSQTPAHNYPHLLIDDRYRFWLANTAHSRQEVKMTPLCKSLYLLFLKYENGIALYTLVDFEAELLEIYKKVGSRANFNQMCQSIRHLVDWRDNSIHEKLARIKAAFEALLSPELSPLYCINGQRGEEKTISLPREFVDYPAV